MPYSFAAEYNGVPQVIANSRALGARLMKYGYKLVTDGTDNHLVLWDMRKEVLLYSHAAAYDIAAGCICKDCSVRCGSVPLVLCACNKSVWVSCSCALFIHCTRNGCSQSAVFACSCFVHFV